MQVSEMLECRAIHLVKSRWAVEVRNADNQLRPQHWYTRELLLKLLFHLLTGELFPVVILVVYFPVSTGVDAKLSLNRFVPWDCFAQVLKGTRRRACHAKAEQHVSPREPAVHQHFVGYVRRGNCQEFFLQKSIRIGLDIPLVRTDHYSARGDFFPIYEGVERSCPPSKYRLVSPTWETRVPREVRGLRPNRSSNGDWSPGKKVSGTVRLTQSVGDTCSSPGLEILHPAS